jgi:hypothetical protein
MTKSKSNRSRNIVIGFIVFCVVALVIILSSLALAGVFNDADTPIKNPADTLVNKCPYANGDTARCPSSTAVWKIENGLARLFTGAAWKRYGYPKPTHDTELVCTNIGKCPGGELIDACPYDDGTIVRCADSTGIYKIENGLSRQYTFPGWQAEGSPSPTIDSSAVCKELLRCPAGTIIN